jgi:hypothetical protein
MMSMKDIQNGSLYANQSNNQILRVRSKANTNSVLATYQDDGAVVAVPAAQLRVASEDEVNGFLA